MVESFRIVPRLDAAGPDLAVPLWRREPYRVLFPLGILFSWAGVAPWLLFAFGLTEEWLPAFHAMVQVQCFLSCMAAGFLFTMIPRRTATRPAAFWEVSIAILAPLGTAAFAFRENWAASQICWVLVMATLLQFALRRFRTRAATSRMPASFIWVLLALAMAMLAPVLAAVGAAGGEDRQWLNDIGRNMALQGVLASLVVGIGALILPHVTRGAAPFEPARGARAFHLALGLTFAGSFFVEQLVSVQLAHALRAVCTAIALIPAARLWLAPTLPGLYRWIALLAGWALPAGYALVTVFPAYRKALLHVVFIGSFGAMSLSIALLFDFDQRHLQLWLGAAASCFIVATLVWLWIALRSLSLKSES
jgi:uncharacterized protein involved in response to NO